MARVLLTGAAGFIGYHLAERLLEQGHAVSGLDNLNAYYDPELKLARLRRLQARPGFSFHKLSLQSGRKLGALASALQPEVVIHLAAQAGVRHSLERPEAYLASNLLGFGRLLEACRPRGLRHLIFASSSSVYGHKEAGRACGEDELCDRPLSLYAATKRSGELMAHAYSHLFGIPTTGLRFFTVYGPWGRPDMALFLFTRAILRGEAIPLYEGGRLRRDFTYVADVAEAVLRLLDKPPEGGGGAPFRLLNVGNRTPVEVLTLIAELEACLGRKAITLELPRHPGDVQETFADTAALERATGFAPATALKDGVARFVAWYRDYYKE